MLNIYLISFIEFHKNVLCQNNLYYTYGMHSDDLHSSVPPPVIFITGTRHATYTSVNHTILFGLY